MTYADVVIALQIAEAFQAMGDAIDEALQSLKQRDLEIPLGIKACRPD